MIVINQDTATDQDLQEEGKARARLWPPFVNLAMYAIDAFLALILTLGAVYGLDRWVLSLREAGYRTFNMTPFWWSAVTANLITGVLLLILAWLVVFRGRRSLSVSLFYLAVGLGLIFLPLLLARWSSAIALLAEPEFRVLRVTLLYSTPNSRLHLVGATVAALGFSALVLDGRHHLARSLLWLADWMERV